MHRKGSEFRMTCHVFVCRDFVCIRQMEISGGSLYAASKTIVTALKPEQPGKVRSDRYQSFFRGGGGGADFVPPLGDPKKKLF